jgi:hypothetical protein
MGLNKYWLYADLILAKQGNREVIYIAGVTYRGVIKNSVKLQNCL